MTPPGDRQRLASLSTEEKRKLLAKMLAERAAAGVGSFPLSHGQRALLFLYRMAPASTAYNLAMNARISSRIDLEAFRRAVRQLGMRHPILRTVYPERAGELVQEVRDEGLVELEVEDAEGRTDPEIEEALQRITHTPFDLENGPIYRVRLFRQSDERFVFLFVVHHIAFDGYSATLLMEELGRLYVAAVDGDPEPPPPRGMQYREFVSWQRQLLDGEEGEKQRRYWEEELAGELAPLDLLTDRPRSEMQRYRGAGHALELSAERTREIHAFARRENCTAYTVLLTALNVLLHRYSGQEEIRVAAPAAGRSRPELGGTIGYLVNPVVFRARLGSDPTFRELLRELRVTVARALAHQDYPFPLLVERLNPERDPGRNPIFQVMIDWQSIDRLAERVGQLSADGERLLLAGGRLEVESFNLPQQEGQFDLALDVFEAKARITAYLKYDADLFLPETIARMASHFEAVLSAALERPEDPVSELPLLPDAERRRILEEWNDTARDYPLDDARLHALVEERARFDPSAPAILDGDRRLSYGELDAQANRLANHLRARGACRGSRVGVCIERSPEQIVAVLGILKAGAAYVPLEPDYPPERLAFLIEDSEIGLILSQERLAGSVPRPGASPPEVLCIDRDPAPFASDSDAPPDAGVRPDDEAYMIYTSGSTGRPKGVATTHRAIVNQMLWMRDDCPLGPDDRVILKTAFGFDVSAWEIFWTLTSGAALVVCRPGGHRDPAYLVDLIEREKATTVHFVASMLQAFLERPDLERCSTVRRVVTSGEALSHDLQGRFFARMSAELYDLYGPTETAVHATWWRCSADAYESIVPIGRPVANGRAYILDRKLQPLPTGVPGELYLGGVQVARGYHRRPELSSERFLPDPFVPDPDARMYRTGDRARFLPDGVIEYLGRLDDQVKLRGFRIELGEIESVLAEHPSVEAAAAAIRGSDPMTRRLVAYVIPQRGATPDAAELREFLRGKLPDYMVPAAVVPLEAFPVTPNGKLDRKALPEPEAPARSAGPDAAPASPLEELLAEIWRELLGVDEISRYDTFFDLGGHSLLSLRVVEELKKRAGISVNPAELVHHTLKQVAAAHEGPAGEAPEEEAPRKPGWKERLLGALGPRKEGS